MEHSQNLGRNRWRERIMLTQNPIIVDYVYNKFKDLKSLRGRKGLKKFVLCIWNDKITS